MLLALTRRRWFWPAVMVAIVVGVFAWQLRYGPDVEAVERQLEERYDVSVEWRAGGKYERDTIIVDGRDVSEDCILTGASGSPDDARIECDGFAITEVGE